MARKQPPEIIYAGMTHNGFSGIWSKELDVMHCNAAYIDFKRYHDAIAALEKCMALIEENNRVLVEHTDGGAVVVDEAFHEAEAVMAANRTGDGY